MIQDPRDGAQANYFYHLASDGGLIVKNAYKGAHTEGKNVIFGYALGKNQPPPQTDSSDVSPEGVITWVDARGVMHGVGKQTIFGRPSFWAGGLVEVVADSTTVTGSETATFLFDVEVDDKIMVVTEAGPEFRRVVAIASDIQELTVNLPFAGSTTQPQQMMVFPFLLRVSDFAASPAPRLFVQDTGNVGIGTADPNNILTVAQNSATDPIADAWTTYSSRRWKTNIRTLDRALEKVQRLRGVAYDRRHDGKHGIGLIGEEVGAVVPEVVTYEENGAHVRSVDYPRLTALLVEAVKEQQAHINRLEAKIDRLRS